METSLDKLNNIESISELNTEEINETSGGGFAYDAGFLLRELFVYAGGGASAVAIDMGVNYRPK